MDIVGEKNNIFANILRAFKESVERCVEGGRLIYKALTTNETVEDEMIAKQLEELEKMTNIDYVNGLEKRVSDDNRLAGVCATVTVDTSMAIENAKKQKVQTKSEIQKTIEE